MADRFRKRLDDAGGVSKQVIVVNIDIRGFTDFCQTVESRQVGTYLVKIYSMLIDRYFHDAEFVKPTGDGLIAVFDYEDGDLQRRARKVVERCLKIPGWFGSACDSDPLINFKVPRRVGIGIARGMAARIESKRTVLDYSGAVLNIASRLMDRARPDGVVIAGDFDMTLLTKGKREKFTEDQIYVRDVADSDPMTIHYQSGLVEISQSDREPPVRTKWHSQLEERTRRGWEKLSPTYLMKLERVPDDYNEVEVRLLWDARLGGRRIEEGMKDIINLDVVTEVVEQGGQKLVSLDVDALSRYLDTEDIPKAWTLGVQITFPYTG